MDVSQQFNSNVQDLWLNYGLPISTYLPEAPYGIGASLPTAFYNLKSPGLDQVAVRKAIAMAVDYRHHHCQRHDQPIRHLHSGSALPDEPDRWRTGLYDHAAVADLQWAGNDIEGAKKLLDEAGIVDTDGDGWREYNGKNLPMSPPARMAGLTGRLPLKSLLPLARKSALTSPPTTLNGLFIRPLSPIDAPLPDRL